MNEQEKRTGSGGTSCETPMAMMKDFYNREMAPWVALTWFWFVVAIVGMIWCGVRFFAAEAVKDQIAYAVGFVCFFQFIPLLKVFAWLLITRRAIARDIRRLEERVDSSK